MSRLLNPQILDPFGYCGVFLLNPERKILEARLLKFPINTFIIVAGIQINTKELGTFCLSSCSIAVKIQHEQGNSYKRNHLIEDLEVYSIIMAGHTGNRHDTHSARDVLRDTP